MMMQARVWSHPGKVGVLGMLSNSSLGSARMCEVLCMIRKVRAKPADMLNLSAVDTPAVKLMSKLQVAGQATSI